MCNHVHPVIFAVFYWLEEIFRPYLAQGERLIQGQVYEEMEIMGSS